MPGGFIAPGRIGQGHKSQLPAVAGDPMRQLHLRWARIWRSRLHRQRSVRAIRRSIGGRTGHPAHGRVRRACGNAIRRRRRGCDVQQLQQADEQCREHLQMTIDRCGGEAFRQPRGHGRGRRRDWKGRGDRERRCDRKRRGDREGRGCRGRHRRVREARVRGGRQQSGHRGGGPGRHGRCMGASCRWLRAHDGRPVGGGQRDCRQQRHLVDRLQQAGLEAGGP